MDSLDHFPALQVLPDLTGITDKLQNKWSIFLVLQAMNFILFWEGGGCALKDRVLFIKVKIKIRILKICFENILDFL